MHEEAIEAAARAIDPEAWVEAPDAAPDFLAEQVTRRLNSLYEAKAAVAAFLRMWEPSGDAALNGGMMPEHAQIVAKYTADELEKP